MYKNEIFSKINTPVIRLKLALCLGVTEQSIRNAIKLKRRLLLEYSAVMLIRKELALDENDLFENPNLSNLFMNSENKTTAILVEESPPLERKMTKKEAKQLSDKIKNARLNKIK